MNKKISIFIVAGVLLIMGSFIGRALERDKHEKEVLDRYYWQIYNHTGDITSTLSFVDEWQLDSQGININGYEKFKKAMYEFFNTYSNMNHLESKYAYGDIRIQTSIESIIHIFNTGLTINGHEISSEAFDEDGVISSDEALFLNKLYILFSKMNRELDVFNVEKKDYDKLYLVIKDNLDLLAEEFSSEKLMTFDQIKVIKETSEVVDSNDNFQGVAYKLLKMDLNMMQDELPVIWQDFWHDIHREEGDLSKDQIDEINELIRPYYSHEDQMMVTPFSCFFTSYYDDVKKLDFTNFLRYFPYGEVPVVLEEFEELKRQDNWPFNDKKFENLPVAIHRYKGIDVEGVLMTYSGIKINELSMSDLEEVIYLESKDSYYNYTSDFGPGYFSCISASVDGDEIKLIGKTNSDSKVVLTIMKDGERYIIKSFHRQ